VPSVFVVLPNLTPPSRGFTRSRAFQVYGQVLYGDVACAVRSQPWALVRRFYYEACGHCVSFVVHNFLFSNRDNFSKSGVGRFFFRGSTHRQTGFRSPVYSFPSTIALLPENVMYEKVPSIFGLRVEVENFLPEFSWFLFLKFENQIDARSLDVGTTAN